MANSAGYRESESKLRPETLDNRGASTSRASCRRRSSPIVSFSAINVALLVTGPDTVTLPVHVFSQVVWQADPTIAAASTLQIVLIAALLGVAQRAFRLRVTV